MFGKLFSELYLYVFLTAIVIMIMVPVVCVLKLLFGFQAALTTIDMVIVFGLVIFSGFIFHHKISDASQVHHS